MTAKAAPKASPFSTKPLKVGSNVTRLVARKVALKNIAKR
jgi:hypothetical protein